MAQVASAPPAPHASPPPDLLQEQLPHAQRSQQSILRILPPGRFMPTASLATAAGTFSILSTMLYPQYTSR